MIEEVLNKGLCDYFAVDFKAPSHRYQEICRGAADAETVLKTIQLLLEYRAGFEVRTTVIPQLREDDLILMAEELPLVPLYTLNRYRKPDGYLPADEVRITEKPHAAEQIKAYAEIIRAWQPNVTI
jgi:pyruvate formate lyase activating enzyme